MFFYLSLFLFHSAIIQLVGWLYYINNVNIWQQYRCTNSVCICNGNIHEAHQCWDALWWWCYALIFMWCTVVSFSLLLWSAPVSCILNSNSMLKTGEQIYVYMCVDASVIVCVHSKKITTATINIHKARRYRHWCIETKSHVHIIPVKMEIEKVNEMRNVKSVLNSSINQSK